MKERQDLIVKERVNALTSDPIMASIFEDTARSTLLEQQERSSPASQPTNQPSVPVENLPGADNWSLLAFND